MNRIRTKISFLFAAAAAMLLTACQSNVIRLVNPFVGTDGHGHTTPAAIVPFGMVQPGPDTRLDGWDGCSGYHYSDDTIYGFSQTHLSGTGCLDYGDVLIAPFTEANLPEEGAMPWGERLKEVYLSTFSHHHEKARPGYYSVILNRNQTQVELTANERCAYHKYTYPNSGQKGFVVDLQHRDRTIDAGMFAADKKIAFRDGRGQVDCGGAPTLLGWRESSSWNPDQKLFFALRCNVSIDHIDYSPDSSQAFVYLDPSVKQAEVTIAISSVDEAGAANNLNHYGIYDFQSALEAATLSWRDALGKIEIEGGTRSQRGTFYTALYHCMTSPYLYSDEDGRYRGMDDSIHTTAPQHPRYTVFSLWDTYRALHPLLTLIDRERTEDFVRTMLGQFEEGGELTMWELWGHETHCMIGYHAAPVILEAYRAGVLDKWEKECLEKGEPSPIDRLIAAMIATSNRTEAHRLYAQTGYLDAESDNESVSKTLEYAYDDWCIAEMARLASAQRDSLNDFAIVHYGDSSTFLSYGDIIETYSRRSESWRNLMDGEGYMHAKKNGGFVTPFDPREVNNHYTEANCCQYSTYVPHNVEGWIEALGGKEKAEAFLDGIFEGKSDMTGRNQSDITGLIGQYAHGNEPSHHAAYLYTYLGKPEKSQKLVNQILTTLYNTKPDGLCGNEDCGQMSAWYVLSACGLYPVCPGSGEFVTTKPLFKKAIIHRSCSDALMDHDLAIDTKSWPCGKFFVPGNFEKQTNDQFHETSILSSTEGNNITPLPYFGDWKQRFDGTASIKILCPDREAELYYTLDGTTPNRESSTRYTGPFSVEEDVTINAIAYSEKTGYSKVVTQKLTQFHADKKLYYLTRPEQQYIENGEEGLIDRIYGTENYRIGGWQGWQKDMEVKVDLLEEKIVGEVGVDCLENMKSWIFFPQAISVEYSTDGTNYSPFGEVENTEYPPTKQREELSTRATFNVKGLARCRYLRIKAKNYGAMPDWHVSAGEQAWLFVDEIEIRETYVPIVTVTNPNTPPTSNQ